MRDTQAESHRIDSLDIWFIILSFMVLAVLLCFQCSHSFLSRSKKLLVYLNNSVSCWVVTSVKIEEFIAYFIEIL